MLRNPTRLASPPTKKTTQNFLQINTFLLWHMHIDVLKQLGNENINRVLSSKYQWTSLDVDCASTADWEAFSISEYPLWHSTQNDRLLQTWRQYRKEIIWTLLSLENQARQNLNSGHRSHKDHYTTNAYITMTFECCREILKT